VTVDTNRTRYFNASSQREKREISNGIVQLLNEASVRFLKLEGRVWGEVSFETARQKVAHAMQYRQRRSSHLKSHPTTHTTTSYISAKVNPVSINVPTTNASSNSYMIADLSLCHEPSLAPLSRSDSIQWDHNAAILFPKNPTTARFVSGSVDPNELKLPTFDQQKVCSSCDVHKLLCLCFREQCMANDLLLMSSHIAESSQNNPSNNVATLEKQSTDEYSEYLSDAYPFPPVHCLSRGTSDFSFGDFSLNGPISSVGDGYDCEHG
jgi:hypothetical protein